MAHLGSHRHSRMGLRCDLCFVPPAIPLHDRRLTPSTGYRILGDCFPQRVRVGPPMPGTGGVLLSTPRIYRPAGGRDTRMHVFTQSLHQVDGRSQQMPTHLSLPSHLCDIQRGALHREGHYYWEGAIWHGSGEEGELKTA